MLLKVITISILIVSTHLVISEFLWTFWQKEVDEFTQWYYKPLFACVTCMTSIWGTIYYVWLSMLFETELSLLEWPLVCISCALVNTVIYKLFRNLIDSDV